MNYKDRFNGKAHQLRKFEEENLMIEFLNENEVDVIQIYPVQMSRYDYDVERTKFSNEFHLIYKIIEKKMI